MKRRCPGSPEGCGWPHSTRARGMALKFVRRNLLRRLTDKEIAYLHHSEVLHELAQRLVKGFTICVKADYLDEVRGGPAIDDWLDEGLAQHRRPELTVDSRRALRAYLKVARA